MKSLGNGKPRVWKAGPWLGFLPHRGIKNEIKESSSWRMLEGCLRFYPSWTLMFFELIFVSIYGLFHTNVSIRSIQSVKLLKRNKRVCGREGVCYIYRSCWMHLYFDWFFVLFWMWGIKCFAYFLSTITSLSTLFILHVRNYFTKITQFEKKKSVMNVIACC